jgi:hypothetical protein
LRSARAGVSCGDDIGRLVSAGAGVVDDGALDVLGMLDVPGVVGVVVVVEGVSLVVVVVVLVAGGVAVGVGVGVVVVVVVGAVPGVEALGVVVSAGAVGVLWARAMPPAVSRAETAAAAVRVRVVLRMVYLLWQWGKPRPIAGRGGSTRQATCPAPRGAANDAKAPCADLTHDRAGLPWVARPRLAA